MAGKRRTGQKPKRPSPTPAAGAADRFGERHAALATLGLLCLLVTLVFGSFFFGDDLYLFRDIGSDTVNLFYPRFVHIADYLRSEGLPGWSFNQGLGQDIRPYALTDPFTWILYACGSEHIAHAIAYVEAAKLVAAGMLMFATLRVIGLLPVTAMIGAVAFAFSSYMVVGGAWYVFASRGVAFGVLLLGFERLLMRGSWWLFPIGIALVAANQPPTLLPFALGMLLYGGMRLIEERGWQPRNFARFAGRISLLGILGLCLSAFFWVGTLRNLVQSPRATLEWTASGRLLAVSLFELEFESHYWSILARAFGSDLLFTGDDFTGWYNYLESPLFYCGLLTLVCFTQAFSVLDRRRRRLYATYCALVFLPVFLPFFRFAYWGFTGNYYREFSLLIVLALLYPGMRGLDAVLRGGSVRPRNLAIGLAVLFTLLLAPIGLTDSVRFDLPLVGLVAAFVLAESALVAVAQQPNWRRSVPPALLAIVCVEAVAFTTVSISRRPVLHKSEWAGRGYDDATREALKLIRARDSGFFRVEKDFGSSPATKTSRNDSKAQGYFGTQSYYSFNQIHYIRFLAEFEFIDRKSEAHTRWAPGFANVIPSQGWGSVKYLLLRDEPEPLLRDLLVPIARFEEFSVYQNRVFVPLGFPVGFWIPAAEIAGLPLGVRRTGLSHVALLEDPVPPAISKTLPRVTREQFADAMANYSLERALRTAESLNESALRIESFSQNRIRGRIQLSSPRLLIFTIPFDSGWTATVNGVTAPLHRVDIGFTGLLLPDGEHEIVLDYLPPLGRAAGIASLAALAWYGLLLLGWRPLQTSQPPSQPGELHQ